MGENLIKFNKNRKFTLEERENISKRNGSPVYIYNMSGNLIHIFTSVIKFKQAFNFTTHHKYIYKYIYPIGKGVLINTKEISNKLIFSRIPLEKNNTIFFNSVIPLIKKKIKGPCVNMSAQPLPSKPLEKIFSSNNDDLEIILKENWELLEIYKIRNNSIFKVIHIENPELSITLNSLLSVADYIKKIDGKSDRATIRKYINTEKLYRNIWKISRNI